MTSNSPSSSIVPRFDRFRRFGFVRLEFLVGAAITTFFLVMMFLLWKREAGLNYTVRQLGISPDFLTATWIDYDQWMWIEQAGVPIGVYNLAVRMDEPTGKYELTTRSLIKLDVLGMRLPVRFDGEVQMTEKFEMDSFQGALKFGENSILAEAFVEGLDLYYQLSGPQMLIAAGQAYSLVPLEGPVMLDDSILPVITQSNQLRVGNKWSTRASDPITGRFDMLVNVEVEAQEILEIDGEEVMTFRVSENAENMRSTSWYDAEGNLLRTDLHNGILMKRTERDQALEKYPDLKLPSYFPPIDRQRIRQGALDSGGQRAENPLFWFPNL